MKGSGDNLSSRARHAIEQVEVLAHRFRDPAARRDVWLGAARVRRDVADDDLSPAEREHNLVLADEYQRRAGAS